MTDSCARAVVLAIAALYDIAEEAGKGPVKPCLAIRAILALMFEASKKDRQPFIDFWKAVTDPGLENTHEDQRNYIRVTNARIQIAGIARTFGMKPQSPEYHDVIEKLRSQQRSATDPDYRSRKEMVEALQRIKHLPRGMTLDEHEMFIREGWTERPR